MCVFLPLTKRNLSRLGNFLIVKYVIEIHVFLKIVPFFDK
jgi:hypothetical protein